MDPADEVPTAPQLRKLRVVDLRKKLQKLELTQSGKVLHDTVVYICPVCVCVCVCVCTGNKEDLITRLRQYYLEQVGVLYLERYYSYVYDKF